MIITNIISGMGNQMFQYAAGRALAARHGVPLRLDLRFYEKQTFRKYELHRFNISAGVISGLDRFRIRFSYINPRGFLRRAARRLPIGRLHLLRDQASGVDPRFWSAPADTVLDGYWQNEGYFKEVASDIRREFTFRLPPDAENAAVLERIRGVGKSVCVHVRRGDYLNNTEVLTVCPPAYYIDALAWMATKVPQAHYFVFSDDPGWTRANVPMPAVSTFVTHNTGKNDPEDLRLMSACDHFIIANSTFSWWAAWLANTPGKQVVAPKRWFKDSHGNEQQIVPPEWTRI
jgi:hypothetical protein